MRNPRADVACPRYSHLTLLESLGSGEFGQVFRGYYRGTEVAIKQLYWDNSIQVPELHEEASERTKVLIKLNYRVVLLSSATTSQRCFASYRDLNGRSQEESSHFCALSCAPRPARCEPLRRRSQGDTVVQDLEREIESFRHLSHKRLVRQRRPTGKTAVPPVEGLWS